MPNDYSTMTNAELNRAIAERKGWTRVEVSIVNRIREVAVGLNAKGDYEETPDFAGDMNAAMELAMEARLSLVNLVEGFYAFRTDDIYHNDGDVMCPPSMELQLAFGERFSPANECPRRAVCIAYLLWSDATGGKGGKS